MADEEIVYGGRIGAKVTYGRTVGGDLVPLMVDDDGKVSIAESGLPSGAATSAKQDTAKGVLDNIEAGIDEVKGLLGEVQASPTENTLLERLKVLEDVLVLIEAETSLRDIGSPVRITNNAASQSVSVPALAKAFSCQAEGGDVRLEIDGAASATSTIRVPEDAWLFFPITGGAQTLYSYGLAGTYSNVRFFA